MERWGNDISFGGLSTASRHRFVWPKNTVQQIRKVLAQPETVTYFYVGLFIFVEVDVKSPSSIEGVVDPPRRSFVAGFSDQGRQFPQHEPNGTVGVDDPSMMRADRLDGFRHKAPSFVGRLG